MQNKYKLPKHTKRHVLGIVGSYESYKRELEAEKKEITSLGGGNISRYVTLDNGERVFMPAAHGLGSSPTEVKGLRLAELHDSYKFKCVTVVDEALAQITRLYPFELADKLSKAIISSCTNGRNFNFERSGIVGLERTCFYEIRLKFLYIVAKNMGI